MQPRVTTVGPLAAANATAIALSQTVPAGGAVALNGALGVFSANSVALAQAGAAGVPLLLNGALSSFWGPKALVDTGAKTVIALLPPNTPKGDSQIYITSAGADAGISFAVVGFDNTATAVRETIPGATGSVVASTRFYRGIVSITPSGATAGLVTVGTFAPVKLDTARRVILTSGGSDAGVTFTITGTNAAGDVITEQVTGAAIGVATSVLDYATVRMITASAATAGTLTVGTNGIAASPWLAIDTWALSSLSGQTVPTGAVNYTVQTSNDDPNSYANPIALAAVNWDSAYAGVVASTTEATFGIANTPIWVRVLLNSGAGSVRMTLVQHGINST